MSPHFKKRPYSVTPKDKIINIDAEKLKTLLEEKRKYIGKQTADILMSVITLVSIVITTLCINNYPNDAVKIVAYAVIVLCVLCLIKIIIDSSVRRYDPEMLFADICGCSENIITTRHIIVQFNKDGRILQVYEIQRDCFLFPNYSIESYSGDHENEKYREDLAKSYSGTTGIEISPDDLEYVGELKEVKSGPDGNMKNYHFVFHKIKSDSDMGGESFEHRCVEHSWMSIKEIMQNKKMWKNNKGVIKFVYKHFFST